MIIFFEYGRLGNQIFQYLGIRHYFPDHRIVFLGCGDLKNLLESVDAAIIPRERFQRLSPYLFAAIREIILRLATIGFIGWIQEGSQDENFSLTKRQGLIPNVYLLRFAYFQNKSFVEKLQNKISIKKDILTKAEEWLNTVLPDWRNSTMVFVNVRRQDYVNWPDSEYPAVLSCAWYQNAINRFRREYKDTKFIIVTNDIFYAEDVFGQEEDVIISRNSVFVDLAIMKLCDHGILSPSSLAWWGAWFARQNPSKTEDPVFIAPKYWIGHRAKRWHPKEFKTSWITYVE
jgi:hypothetical protein